MKPPDNLTLSKHWKSTKGKTIVAIIVLTLLVTLALIYNESTPSAPTDFAHPKDNWTQSSSTAKTTQERSYFAVSQRTRPTHQLDFPYNQLTASIGFGCDKSTEWMYLAFSEPPNIANAETENEINTFVAKIKFNDQPGDYKITQKFGARFLHFRDDNLIAEMVMESSSMLLEVDWYRVGPIRFPFSLSGSVEEIESARIKCSGI